MKVPGAAGEDVRFDMTAMMDIVFQLIAFFMIVSTFIVAEKIELELPIAPNAATAENQAGRLVFSVTADGTVWRGAEPVNVEEVARLAHVWQQQESARRVVIRSDRSTPYAQVKQVMKACRDAGMTDIIFASYQSEP